jgi:signal transduction histidine kinase
MRDHYTWWTRVAGEWTNTHSADDVSPRVPFRRRRLILRIRRSTTRPRPPGRGETVPVLVAPDIIPARRNSVKVVDLVASGSVVAVLWQFLKPKELAVMPDAETKKSEAHRMSRTLAVLAHELRAPLSAIEYAAARVAEHSDGAELREAREVIHRQVRQIAGLLDYFTEGWQLGVARCAPSAPPEVVRLDLRDVVRDGVETVRVLIAARSHALKVSLPERPVLVLGDRVRLVQVVVNLLTNAAKFTPSPGEVHVTLTHDVRRATLRVRDTGLGIPTAMRERIFKPFTRLHPALGDVAPGLGVGLAVVRNTVAAHRGIVTVFSGGRGRGSEFVVRLPTAAATSGSAA